MEQKEAPKTPATPPENPVAAAPAEEAVPSLAEQIADPEPAPAPAPPPDMEVVAEKPAVAPEVAAAPDAAATPAVAPAPAPAPAEVAPTKPAKKEKPPKQPKPPKPPKQPGSGVGAAIFATVVIVLALAGMAVYAYMQS